MNFKGLFLIGAFMVAILWFCYALVDWVFIDNVVKSETLIKPEIEIIIKNKVVDTIYVYREP